MKKVLSFLEVFFDLTILFIAVSVLLGCVEYAIHTQDQTAEDFIIDVLASFIAISIFGYPIAIIYYIISKYF